MAKTVQILMNVLALKPTNVIQTPCVPTLKGHMFVAVKGDILVVAKTAQMLTSVQPLKQTSVT